MELTAADLERIRTSRRNVEDVVAECWAQWERQQAGPVDITPLVSADEITLHPDGTVTRTPLAE